MSGMFFVPIVFIPSFQIFGQLGSPSMGLWRSRDFHGKLLSLTKRPSLQKCPGKLVFE